MTKIDVSSIKTANVEKLARVFAAHGFEIRFVGGCVRDVIRGMKPKDIDFATNANPDEMVSVATPHGIRMEPTGLQHGTVSFIMDDEVFEVTSCREDQNCDGRHADVVFTRSFEVDAARRDFTFNAMSADMDGNVFDFFGGFDDAVEGTVRFVGKAHDRVHEDFLRVLRFFRFHARMGDPGWSPVLDDFDVFEDPATHAGLQKVSVERVWAEMSKTMVAANRVSAMVWMFDCGVAQAIGMSAPSSFDQDKVRNWVTNAPDAVTAMAPFVGTDPDAFARKWKMSVTEREQMVWVHKWWVRGHSERWAMQDAIVNGTPVDWVANVAIACGDGARAAQSFRDWVVPVFPVRGQDFVDAGMPAGKQVGVAMKRARDAWMSSRFKKDKAACMAAATA